MRCSPARLWTIALGCLSVRFMTVEGKKNTIGPAEACANFAAGSELGSAWTMADCTDVWDHFTATVPSGLQARLTYAEHWREAAAELRRAGSPCLSAMRGGGDGLGSMTMRILSSWVFSEEMGCDWVTPDWGRRHVRGGDGTVLYCHRTVTPTQGALLSKDGPMSAVKTHCTVVDWLEYFQFGVPSVDLPEGANITEIEISSGTLRKVEETKSALKEGEFANQGYDRILFRFSASFACRYLVALGNWDKDRQHTVRTVMERARENFHVQPRPWYEEHPACAYDLERLNFAIHVRMGDRRLLLGESEEYFQFLERFMDTVSEEVVRKGLQPPLFHVFSETLVPCPSEDTGLFEEFPSWPVHKVPECLTAKAPTHCPEKKAGRQCSPERAGTFDVIGMPLVLHVGPDVHNALSCMIQADGVLMGCSTFGQLAGIFSRGISFFSKHCSGYRSPSQYKLIPPIAVAERGHMWVPVEGSWHDPRLNSTEVLSGTLDIHLKNKGVTSRESH